MAYQALYRKYRPASFDEVVGQKHIVKTLQNAVEKNRIAHAYLFCGPRGTGKTSIAKIFARTLNCTGEKKPCMECENCRLSLAGTHPDIIEIDAASNNGVDEVRNLIDRVGYAPLEGKYKVYIIDEVHMMTSGAFNALLKTIEEPPEHVIFIFATTEPHKVLPTILSRCQRYDFSKVSHQDILDRLKWVCEQENITAEESALSLIADLADGGMRDALSILDQTIAYDQEGITLDSVRDIYGVVRDEDIGYLVSLLTPESVDEAMKFLEDTESRGMDMKRFTADMIGLLKDSVLIEMAANTSLISEERKEVLRKYLLDIPVGKRTSLLNELMNLYNKLVYASNQMDYLETVLLKSALWKPERISVPAYENNRKSYPPVSNSSESNMKSTNEIQKSRHISQKSKLNEIFWNSDVSRETSLNKEKRPSEITFSEDFLLSLLVGANKSEKNKDSDHMKNSGKYASNLKYGKYYNSLNFTETVASGETYILFSTPDTLAKEQINSLQNAQGYEGYFKEILGKPKKAFAITKKEANKLVNLFVKRRNENSLPDPAVIPIDSETGQEIPIEKQLADRFSNLQIVDD